MTPLRIALLANLKDNAPVLAGASDDVWDDLDSMSTIQHILDALCSGGHRAEFFEASLAFDLVEKLRTFAPDLCFNIAEGHWGDGREAQIPAVLEMLRIPYTGSGVLSLALSLDKPMTKRVLSYHDLPTPEFQVFGSPDEPINEDLIDEEGSLRYALFVKPSREGTGIGVHAKSVVTTEDELRSAIADLQRKYPQPILVERYIKGREVTVGVLGNLGKTAPRRLNERTAPTVLPDELVMFPAMEINTESYPTEGGIYTNRIKVELVHDFFYTCPADIDDDLDGQLKLLTAAVFRVMGCHDVARVDFRIDADGQPWILEINPLPGLNPTYSDLCIEAKAMGWEYAQLINAIVTCAAERYGLSGEAVATDRPAPHADLPQG